MRQTTDNLTPASAALLGASKSSSDRSVGSRKVRLSDCELLARVQRVMVPDRTVDLRHLSSKRSWKRVRRGTLDMHFRVLRAPTTVAPFCTRQCQVVVGGEIKAKTSELWSLLQCPTESESNAVLRALYGSKFIFSSLLHAFPCVERGVHSSSPERENGRTTPDQQLTVRTVSFVHHRRFHLFQPQSSVDPSLLGSEHARETHSGHKNEQCCYIELLTRKRNGLQLAFCTLNAAEVSAGKAPPERVVAVHPLSGWLLAEPKPGNPEILQITFQAAFPGKLPGNCDFHVARARLLCIGKGFCRLEKVLRRRRRSHRHRHTVHGRLWQAIWNPFRSIGLTGSMQEHSRGTHHNWHCIACTQAFLPTVRKSWSRCDLCAYRICNKPPCCTQERVAIYNRYVAPLLVCARCRECIGSPHRGNGNSLVRTGGDGHYTGISLQFTGLETERDLQFELDPLGQNVERGRSIHPSRRLSGGMQRKGKAHSDPPLHGLAFLSSEDDESSSGAEFVPGPRTKC